MWPKKQWPCGAAPVGSIPHGSSPGSVGPSESGSLMPRGGGLRAVLIPLLDGGFSVLVDPDLTPSEVESGADAMCVRKLRLAHELAHSFFYADGAPPVRIVAPGLDEESFCERFAEAVVSRGQSDNERSAGK